MFWLADKFGLYDSSLSFNLCFWNSSLLCNVLSVKFIINLFGLEIFCNSKPSLWYKFPLDHLLLAYDNNDLGLYFFSKCLSNFDAPPTTLRYFLLQNLISSYSHSVLLNGWSSFESVPS